MLKQSLHFILISSYKLLVFSLIIYGCATPAKIVNTPENKSDLEVLRDNITYLISDPNLFNAQIGVYIESIKSGQTIFSHNEHKLFISASNMKIFTTATALLKFGPRFRYRTSIYHSEQIVNGTIKGDLIIKGSGDPSIAPRFSDGDSRYFFRAWADSLLVQGVKRIDGDIIGDASYFQTEPLGYGWQWDDEPFWYSAQINALTFNDNCIDVAVVANEKIGEHPNVYLSPPTSYFSVDNKAVIVKPDSIRSLFVTRPRLENKILVRNQIPINKPRYEKSISVENPAKFFVHVLSEVLKEKGISIGGRVRVVNRTDQINYDEFSLLFTHQSPPLSDIIFVVNKKSQNLYAEQLLTTIAAEYGRNATASEGVKVVISTLARMGISENEFLMHDGSGLSRVNLISPNSVGLLLRYMEKHDYFEYFWESLPIGGVDGTLRGRMRASPAAGKVRAKTGYVGHVRNLSGYVESAGGELFLFSILVNNYLHPTPAINLLQDRICILLSNFSQ